MQDVPLGDLKAGVLKRHKHPFRVTVGRKVVGVMFPASEEDADTLEILLSPELVRQLATPDTRPRTTLAQLREKERLVRNRTRQRR